MSIFRNALQGAPVATDDEESTNEDFAITLNPLSNDTDLGGGLLTITGVGLASNGVALNNGDGTITYTPDDDFNGVDSFSYTIQNSDGITDSGTITITVIPVNDPPSFGTDDVFTTVVSDQMIMVGSMTDDGSVGPEDHVLFEWNEATDVDGDDIDYTFLVASDAALSSVLIERESTTFSDSLSVDALATIMSDAGQVSNLDIWITVTLSDGQSGDNPTPLKLSLVRGFIVSAEDAAIPTKFALWKNYPNPFNPSTTIKYDVAASTEIEIALFDVLGRQLSIVVSGPHSAGTYQVVFDASSLPSGIYVYVMRSASFMDSKTMTLVK